MGLIESKMAELPKDKSFGSSPIFIEYPSGVSCEKELLEVADIWPPRGFQIPLEAFAF
jgi:hypothetical protein